MDTQQLVDELKHFSYEALFLRMDETALNQLWNEGKNQQQLAGIARDTHQPTLLRFLAAEILFHKDSSYPPSSDRPALASVYADALTNENATPNANVWGMPGELDGGVGRHLMRIGDAVVPALTPLLTNDTKLYYEGSEEATIGNGYEYRVKDFAAFFISRLRSISYTVHENPIARDAEIQELRHHLQA